MWPNSTETLIAQRLAALRAEIAGGDHPQIAVLGGKIAPRGYVAQVGVIPVGAGDHAPAAFQRLVGENPDAFQSHRAERAQVRPQQRPRLFRRGRAERVGAQRRGQLGFTQGVIPAQQDQDRLAVHHVHQRLDHPVAAARR